MTHQIKKTAELGYAAVFLTGSFIHSCIRYEELKMILDIDLWCAKDIFSISPISIRNGHVNS